MEGDGKEKGGSKLGGTNLRVQLLSLALRNSAVCHKVRIAPGLLNIRYDKLKTMNMWSLIRIVR